LIVASRTDEELRLALTPVTERFHQQVDDCFYILSRGSEYADPQINMAVNLSMSLLRGMGVQTVLYNRPEYYASLLNAWLEIMERVLGPAQST
jgi:hypothetical protein